MSDLRAALGEAAGAAFAELGLAPDFGRMAASDRPDLADFQCNGALAAAKAERRNPREIAAAVVAALAGSPMVASATAKGSAGSTHTVTGPSRRLNRLSGQVTKRAKL